MGNNPTGKRRGSEDDDVQSRTSTFGNKKKLIQPLQDPHSEDAITKILNQNSLSQLPASSRHHRGAAVNEQEISSDVNDDFGTPNRPKTLPTVFKWEGGGKDVFISGTFNSWSAKIPMVKSNHNFYTIIDLPEGEHQYKFIVDGQWKVDSSQSSVQCTTGTQNNVLTVKPSDFDVLEALSHDMAHSKTSQSQVTTSQAVARRQRTISVDSAGEDTHSVAIPSRPVSTIMGGGSPPGEYVQEVEDIPPLPEIGQDKHPTPPLIPPQLLQVILNKNTGAHCDPNLLPHPNHVMVNHMYALSIKDGVIVLSAITRYRKKFVSTVIYKPI